MVKVTEYEYDGGTGDGNLTKVTQFLGGSTANWVTQTFYDWRDRAVAVKAGVESSESTSVNRPIRYTDYDNLGEVTKTRLYDGDAVTITSTNGVPDAPSAALLRAQSATNSDEWGRAYLAQTSSVDPSSGSVGANTLNTNTWYDSRGDVQGKPVNSGPPGPAVLAVPLGEADNSPTAQTEFASCYAVKIGTTGAEHESDSATLAEVLQNARLTGGDGETQYV